MAFSNKIIISVIAVVVFLFIHRLIIQNVPMYVHQPSLRDKQRLWIQENHGRPNGYVSTHTFRVYMQLLLPVHSTETLKKI
jgi:hypothetical protein